MEVTIPAIDKQLGLMDSLKLYTGEKSADQINTERLLSSYYDNFLLPETPSLIVFRRS
jgi:hypothetical protein